MGFEEDLTKVWKGGKLRVFIVKKKKNSCNLEANPIRGKLTFSM